MSILKEHRLNRLAWFLDSSIKLPGGFRVGVESLIGLVPGVGDALGALVSSYIIYEAAKMGVSVNVLFKMIINVMLETIVGAIPIAGDIFDMAFKSNLRNVNLLQQHITCVNIKPRTNRNIITLVLLVFSILIILFMWIIIQIISILIEQFNQF